MAARTSVGSQSAVPYGARIGMGGLEPADTGLAHSAVATTNTAIASVIRAMQWVGAVLIPTADRGRFGRNSCGGAGVGGG